MNSIWYRLSHKVGVEKGPHTSECTSSKGFVVYLTGTLMNFCLCLAWMQTVNIESSFVYPLTRDFMAVGFISASRRCQILDSEIVRDFRVDLVLAAIGALDDSIVGSIVGSSVGEVSLFLLFPFSVDDDRSAVAETMIYMRLISFPARLQEDGKVMEHFPFRNIVVCPPKSKWLIDRRESRKVGVWRALTC
jgi:hypothetical protein